MDQILNLKAKITTLPEENKRTTLCLEKTEHTKNEVIIEKLIN